MLSIEIGSRFGRLVVLELIKDAKNPKAKCICDCGAICTPQRGSLRNGRAQSCGCMRREKLLQSAKKHGMSQSPIYSVWHNMLSRCNDPSNKHFKNYGGRGIRVHYKNFEEFYADVGDRPEGHWIDRIDNEKGYQPGNCEWVPIKKNSENKRVSRFWVIQGVIYESSVQAAKALGVTPSVIVRGCNGCTRNGTYYPPKPGWSSALKYEKQFNQGVSND